MATLRSSSAVDHVLPVSRCAAASRPSPVPVAHRKCWPRPCADLARCLHFQISAQRRRRLWWQRTADGRPWTRLRWAGAADADYATAVPRSETPGGIGVGQSRATAVRDRSGGVYSVRVSGCVPGNTAHGAAGRGTAREHVTHRMQSARDTSPQVSVCVPTVAVAPI